MPGPSKPPVDITGKVDALKRALFMREANEVALVYKDILTHRPDFLLRGPVQYDLACVLERGGHDNLALEAFHLLLEKQPDNKSRNPALRAAGHLAFKLKRYDLCRKYLKEFLSTEPLQSEVTEAREVLDKLPPQYSSEGKNEDSQSAVELTGITYEQAPGDEADMLFGIDMPQTEKLPSAEKMPPPKPPEGPPPPPSQVFPFYQAPTPYVHPQQGYYAGAVYFQAPTPQYTPDGQPAPPQAYAVPYFPVPPSPIPPQPLPQSPIPPQPVSSPAVPLPPTGIHIHPQPDPISGPGMILPPTAPASPPSVKAEPPSARTSAEITTPAKSPVPEKRDPQAARESADQIYNRLRNGRFALMLPRGKRIRLDEVANFLSKVQGLDQSEAKKAVLQRKGLLMDNLTLTDVLSLHPAVERCPQALVFVHVPSKLRSEDVFEVVSAHMHEKGLKMKTIYTEEKVRWGAIHLINCGIIDTVARVSVIGGDPLREFRFVDAVFDIEDFLPSHKKTLRDGMAELLDYVAVYAVNSEKSHTVQAILDGRADRPQVFSCEAEYRAYNNWMIFSAHGEPIDAKTLAEINRVTSNW